MGSSFPFSPPTLLAPMWGVLPAELHHLVAVHQPPGLVCLAFLRVTRTPQRARWFERHLLLASVRPVSVQLLGRDPDQMARAAGILSTAGAAVVDVNLGCPKPSIVRKGTGSALLERPEQVRALLGAMRRTTDCLLSVKLRAGVNDRESALSVACIAEDAGVDFVTLHPRSSGEMFGGTPDWHLVAELKRALRIPVVGNGDTWYAADALRLQRATGCDAVMIGRPALRNPWIFLQLEQLRRGEGVFRPTAADLLGHVDRLATALGRASVERPRGALDLFKEHVTWILRGPTTGQTLLPRAMRAQSVSELCELLRSELEALPPDAFDLGPERA
ncbi:MAG: tRNA-dihydrouridine synthase family protein [Polyangiaceae bacterium]|nr:tRNA-dihydrouridine synthase family protein [Polyangiaceae bacterium]